MVIWSNRANSVTKAELDGDEWEIMRRMVNRVQPLNEQEAAFLVDIGNEEDEEWIDG